MSTVVDCAEILKAVQKAVSDTFNRCLSAIGRLVQSEYVDRKVAARILSMSASKLEKLAENGEGPPFYKMGKNVRYKRSELTRWADDCPRGPDFEAAKASS